MKGDENNNPRWVEMTRKEILEEKKISGTGIKIDFDLAPQEKSMINDPILDTCGSLEFVVDLIKKIRETNNMDNYHHTLHFCLLNLKKFRDAPLNSDHWKSTQAAENNGGLLTKAFNLANQKHLAKSEELKTEIINNLESWVLDFSYLRNRKSEPPRDIDINYLTPEHNQEIRTLMVENILETPDDWRIVKRVGWLEEETGQEWYVNLLLENIKNPQKSFDIRTFTKEEWEKIKQIVTNHQCRDLEAEYLKNHWENPTPFPKPKPSKKEQKNLSDNSNKRVGDEFYFLIAVSLLISIVIYLLWITKRTKNRKKV